MDFEIGGSTLRDKLEPGPGISPLHSSKLSNILGCSGFVKTLDNKYVFIIRNDKVSFCKNEIQGSVGGAVKSKYALNDKGFLTCDGLLNAIKEEVVDELSLVNLPSFNERKDALFKELSLENIQYFCRDLEEGGRPHLFFMFNIPITSDEVGYAINKGKEVADSCQDVIEKLLMVDGSDYIFIDESEIQRIKLGFHSMTYNGLTYKMPMIHCVGLALLQNEYTT